MAKDPVCGMQVDKKNPAGKSEYKGKIYFFCSPGCKESFEEEPDKYINKDEVDSGSHHNH